jgi:hypothetical protein
MLCSALVVGLATSVGVTSIAVASGAPKHGASQLKTHVEKVRSTKSGTVRLSKVEAPKGGRHAAPSIDPASDRGTAHPATSRGGKPAASGAEVTPNALGSHFDGIAETTSGCCGSSRPFVAAGPDNFIEATQYSISVFDRAGTLLHTASIASMFGLPDGAVAYSSGLVYDPVWQRYNLAATESSPGAAAFYATSVTSDPLGDWFWSGIAPGMNPGDTVNQTRLGMDQDALILTYSVYDSASAFVDSALFTVPKWEQYNQVPVFNAFARVGLPEGVRPAIVTSGEDVSREYLLQYDPGLQVMHVLWVVNTGHRTVDQKVFTKDITGNFAAPPQRDVNQPNTAWTLFAGDGTISTTPSYANGRVWFARNADDGGFPGVEYGYINVGTPQGPKVTPVATTNFAYHSASSDDFDPSIVATVVDGATYTTLNWQYTDVSNGKGLSDVSSTVKGTGVPLRRSGGVVYAGNNANKTTTGDGGLISAAAPDYAVEGTCAAASSAFLGGTYFSAGGLWRTRLAVAKPSVC